jgi:DegV family protein with EDD domain
VNKVLVVTDSSATVPADLVEQLGIRVVPILLVAGGRTYRDGVDITAEQVYHWLRSGECVPTTSAPSVGDFLRIYTAAAQQASGIVSIHISPSLSAIYNAALTASQLVDDIPIRLINSHTAAMGQGFVVLEAARAAATGADLETVVQRATDVAARMNLLATIDTLDYLHRGGRIGGAAALLGTVLQIKPILYLTDGHVDVFAKPRTKSRAISLMLRQMAEVAQGRPIHAAILHADVPLEAEILRQQVAEQFDCTELYITPLTPVMGAHTGPGVLGVTFYVD